MRSKKENIFAILPEDMQSRMAGRAAIPEIPDREE